MNLFLEHVKSYSRNFPNRPAVQVYNGEMVRYGELLEAISKRSQFIEGYNIIDSPKGIIFIIELLATWEAGAVAVILNPDFPLKRKREIIKQVEGKFAEIEAVEDLLYLIFSSGSSGKPKGVMVPYQGFLPMAQEQSETFNFNEKSRMLWMHQVGFDASISDIGVTLLSGGTLCIPGHINTTKDLYQQCE